MIKHLIIVCLALGFAMPSAAAKSSSVKDSLLRIYLAAPHDSTRLDVLHDIARLDQLTPTFLYYENKLLQEATQQNNLKYQSISTYEHMIYFFNRIDIKRLTYWMNRMETLAEENNYYKDYFKAKKLQIELYTFSQQIEFAIHEANAMYDQAEKQKSRSGMREACICLMTAYVATLRYEEGTQMLEKAFQLTEPQDSPMERTDLLTKAVLVYSLLHDNEKMFSTLQMMEVAINEMIAAAPALKNAYSAAYMGMETQYSLYYIRTGQARKAWEHLQKVDKYYTPTIFLPYRVSRLAAYSEYYHLLKDYNKALEYLDQVIQIMEQMSYPDAIIYNTTRANMLVDMGLPDKAIDIYRKVINDKDSLYRNVSNSQMEQIQAIYNIDKYQLEQEKRQEILRYTFLTVIAVVLLTLIILVIRTYFSRKKLQKEAKEVSRLSRIAEEANEMKTHFLANMSYNIRIPLNNVVGFSQLLSIDAELDEKDKQEYSAIIRYNSGQLIQMVNDVLDLSRLEAKMMKFQMQDCEIQDICNDLVCMAQMDSNGHIHVELENNVGSQMLKVDAQRIGKAILSMLLYPIPDNNTDRTVKMRMDRDETNKLLVFHIINSPLVDPAFKTQQVSIQLNINQLLFEYFGGSFTINNDKEGRPITFTVAYTE